MPRGPRGWKAGQPADGLGQFISPQCCGHVMKRDEKRLLCRVLVGEIGGTRLDYLVRRLSKPPIVPIVVIRYYLGKHLVVRNKMPIVNLNCVVLVHFHRIHLLQVLVHIFG